MKGEEGTKIRYSRIEAIDLGDIVRYGGEWIYSENSDLDKVSKQRQVFLGTPGSPVIMTLSLHCMGLSLILVS